MDTKDKAKDKATSAKEMYLPPLLHMASTKESLKKAELKQIGRKEDPLNHTGRKNRCRLQK
jgi:hypothetical protein